MRDYLGRLNEAAIYKTVGIQMEFSMVRRDDLKTLIAENESLRKDAERFKWLNRQRSQVWRLIADMPCRHTSAYIDEAISSPENPS